MGTAAMQYTMHSCDAVYNAQHNFLYNSCVAISATHLSQRLHNNSVIEHACHIHILQRKYNNALQNLDFV